MLLSVDYFLLEKTIEICMVTNTFKYNEKARVIGFFYGLKILYNKNIKSKVSIDS